MGPVGVDAVVGVAVVAAAVCACASASMKDGSAAMRHSALSTWLTWGACVPLWFFLCWCRWRCCCAQKDTRLHTHAHTGRYARARSHARTHTHLRGVCGALGHEAVEAGAQRVVRERLDVAVQLLGGAVVCASVGEAKPRPELRADEIEQHADGRDISREVEARLRFVVRHGRNVDRAVEVAGLASRAGWLVRAPGDCR